MPHFRTYYDRDFIGSPDLYGADGKTREYTLTIAKVEQGQLAKPGTSRKERKPVLTFEETQKKMVCVVTNANTIASMYGPLTEQWAGKRITLYVGQTAFGGKACDGLRVRNQIPKAKAVRSAPPGAADNPVELHAELTGSPAAHDPTDPAFNVIPAGE